MKIAKLFWSGNSQAVRLPKGFRLSGDSVKIYRSGEKVILEPVEPSWDSFFESLNKFPEDFLSEGRKQPEMQTRDSLE